MNFGDWGFVHQKERPNQVMTDVMDVTTKEIIRKSGESWKKNVYPDDRTGESNTAVNARQVRVNQDYHKKANDLDTRLGGDQRDGFDAELSTFG